MRMAAVLTFLLLSFFLHGCPATTKTSTKQQNSTTSTNAPKSQWKTVKGVAASNFRLRDINDRSHNLKQYKGKVVLLNFWATWCAPCLKEFPHVQKLHERYKNQGLKVLAVSVDEGNSVSQVKPMIYRYGYNFSVLLDTEGRVVTRVQVEASYATIR